MPDALYASENVWAVSSRTQSLLMNSGVRQQSMASRFDQGYADWPSGAPALMHVRLSHVPNQFTGSRPHAQVDFNPGLADFNSPVLPVCPRSKTEVGFQHECFWSSDPAVHALSTASTSDLTRVGTRILQHQCPAIAIAPLDNSSDPGWFVDNLV